MPYVTSNKTVAKLKATLEDGTVCELKGDVSTTKEYYPIKELDERVNLMGLFKSLSQICKSSTDIVILGTIIEYANAHNEILIPNQTSYAKELGISRKQLIGVLTRAEEVNLLHKLDTGRYLLNPYKVMCESACARPYKHQELIQVRWKEETGLFTELELSKLNGLSNHLELAVGLRPTAYNLSVAEYYYVNHQITDKQRKAILKHIN